MARLFPDEKFACIRIERLIIHGATLEIVDQHSQTGLLFTAKSTGYLKTSYWPYQASTQRNINRLIKNTQFRRQLFPDLTRLMSETYAWILQDQ